MFRFGQLCEDITRTSSSARAKLIVAGGSTELAGTPLARLKLTAMLVKGMKRPSHSENLPHPAGGPHGQRVQRLESVRPKAHQCEPRQVHAEVTPAPSVPFKAVERYLLRRRRGSRGGKTICSRSKWRSVTSALESLIKKESRMLP